MITICVGLWDNRSSLSFCSTSGGLPKLAQLQLGEGGEAGTERPNFLRANIFFRGHITVQLSLSRSPSQSLPSTPAAPGAIYLFIRALPSPHRSVSFSQLPPNLQGAPCSLARSTFALYPRLAGRGLRS